MIVGWVSSVVPPAAMVPTTEPTSSTMLVNPMAVTLVTKAALAVPLAARVLELNGIPTTAVKLCCPVVRVAVVSVHVVPVTVASPTRAAPS